MTFELAFSGILPRRPSLKKRAHCFEMTPSGVASLALFVRVWIPTAVNPASLISLRSNCGSARATEMTSAAARQIKRAAVGGVFRIHRMVRGLLRRLLVVVNAIETPARVTSVWLAFDNVGA